MKHVNRSLCYSPGWWPLQTLQYRFGFHLTSSHRLWVTQLCIGSCQWKDFEKGTHSMFQVGKTIIRAKCHSRKAFLESKFSFGTDFTLWSFITYIHFNSFNIFYVYKKWSQLHHTMDLDRTSWSREKSVYIEMYWRFVQGDGAQTAGRWGHCAAVGIHTHILLPPPPQKKKKKKNHGTTFCHGQR